METKRALITGISGQDGSYLAELLIQKGYEVHGMVRRSSRYYIGSDVGASADDFIPRHKNIILHYGDLSDFSSVDRIVRESKPHEIYNLAAMSDVRVSFDVPEYTSDVTGLGALRVIESVRNNGLTDTRIYQASSSELYGKVIETPQKETTPFYPRSPYAVSKAYAYWMCKNYRESYGMFISNGILFNHESPRRGPNFVTSKICRAAVRIKNGTQEILPLGNINAKRDWGFAPEYVEAMWRMLQHTEPDDFVLATGETHSVEEFLVEAFSYVGLDWKQYVKIEPHLFRPAEVDLLCGDATKAREKLGWTPKTTFKQLVQTLMEAEMSHGANKA